MTSDAFARAVGNDLVDLADRDADASTFSLRFDERVFSPAERADLRAHAEPERQRWRLWAAKEAAFKAARKLDARTVFAPSRFAVALEGGGAGATRHAGRVYPLRWREEGTRIHVCAVSPAADPEAVLWSWGPMQDGDAGRSARELAIRTLALHLDTAPDELEIVRAGRVPVLRLRGAPAAVDLSLSHHGSWVAFAALPLESRRASAA